MAYTQADLDALDRAIADGRGARSISFNDQTAQFSSVDEMLRLRAVMSREIAAASGTAVNYRLAVTKKGT